MTCLVLLILFSEAAAKKRVKRRIMKAAPALQDFTPSFFCVQSSLLTAVREEIQYLTKTKYSPKTKAIRTCHVFQCQTIQSSVLSIWFPVSAQFEDISFPSIQWFLTICTDWQVPHVGWMDGGVLHSARLKLACCAPLQLKVVWASLIGYGSGREAAKETILISEDSCHEAG